MTRRARNQATGKSAWKLPRMLVDARIAPEIDDGGIPVIGMHGLAIALPSARSPSWFDRYPDFAPSKAGLWNNFCRLSKKRQWGSEKKGEMWIQCLIAEFNNKVASQAEIGKLEKWQELCRDVYINNPPASIKQCKKVCINILTKAQC